MPKYLIRAPRFLNGEVVNASPEHPVVIELPEGTKVDKALFPVDSDGAAPLRPHFADRGRIPSSREVQSQPIDAPKGKKGRASDGEPI